MSEKKNLKKDLIFQLAKDARDKKWSNEKIELEMYKMNDKIKSSEDEGGFFSNLIG